MVRARLFGCQQQEHQIDRLVVHRLEVDRLVQAGEDPANLLQARQLAVRYGDAVTDAGRAEPLALQ
jgi:hypothetical protein